jgi:hypothetical protein
MPSERDAVDWDAATALLAALDRADDPASLTRAVGEVVHRALVGPSVDWPAFLGSDRGRAATAALARGETDALSLEDCRALLVAMVRQDRFVEGALEDALRAGRVTAVLRRAAALRPEPAGR